MGSKSKLLSRFSKIAIASLIAFSSITPAHSSWANNVSIESIHILSCKKGQYKNTAGKCISSPKKADSWPQGSSAKCGDGTYSFSQSRRGTCSRHGGVAIWR
ncbi:MAG: DUF3761 domain-containing protein [Actinobacteria bacterium]|nr:DUF3761 domain-containing protein [Actinomycetota bacterium]